MKNWASDRIFFKKSLPFFLLVYGFSLLFQFSVPVFADSEVDKDEKVKKVFLISNLNLKNKKRLFYSFFNKLNLGLKSFPYKLITLSDRDFILLSAIVYETHLVSLMTKELKSREWSAFDLVFVVRFCYVISLALRHLLR